MPYNDSGSYCQRILQTICLYRINHYRYCVSGFLCIAKPILYAGKVLTGAESAFLEDESVIDTFILTLNHACCVIVSPIGQAAQIIKAAAGIIYPVIYFKKDDNNLFFVDGIVDVEHGFKVALSDFFGMKEFKCDADNVENDPVGILHDLVTDLRSQNKNCYFYVKFTGQNGSDSGGLSSGLICSLFEALSRKKEDGKEKPTLELAEKVRTPFDENERKAFQDLGVVLGWLLFRNQCYALKIENACEPLLAGAGILSPALLKGAFAFSTEEVQQNFSGLSVERKVEIWLTAFRDEKTEEHVKNLLMTASIIYSWKEGDNIEITPELIDSLAGLFDIPEIEDNGVSIFARNGEGGLRYSDDELRERLQKNITAVRNALDADLPNYLGAVETLHLIAKGMCEKNADNWEVWQRAGAAVNQRLIEGTFNRKEVLKRFEFENLNGWRKYRIKKWIKSLDDDQLKQLLKTMKGSSSLAEDRKLTFQGVSKNPDGSEADITFPHTCYWRMDISNRISISEVIVDLNNWISSGNNLTYNEI